MTKSSIQFQSSLFPNNNKYKNLLEQIHQLIIDLESHNSKIDIENIINQSLFYLNKNIDTIEKNEIISLISSCFLCYPNPSKELINQILIYSRKNYHYTILTAFMCSIYSNLKEISSIPLFHSFVFDSMNIIYFHIKNKTPNDDLLIFSSKIHPNNQANFIIDIITANGINERTISIFAPYLFSLNNFSETKMNAFISKIINLGLSSKLPESILTRKKYLFKLTMNEFTNLIVKTSDEVFTKIFPFFEIIFKETKTFNKNFVTMILYKIIKLKIDTKFINNLIDSLLTSHLKPAVWKYLDKCNITLPDQLATQIQEFPCPSSALKIMPHFEMIPPDIFIQGLYENSDFNVYQRTLIPDFILTRPNPIFSDSKFWTHLTDVISKHDKKCSDGFISNLAVIFKNFNDSKQFNEIFSEMIFTNFPTNNNCNYFFDKFYYKFDYNYRSFYDNKQNIVKLADRIIENKVIPLPSFWKVFNIFSLEGKLKNNIENPFLLCAYEFSFMRDYISKINQLIILPQTNPSNQDLIIEFIKQNKIDYLVNMNEESLSLIINSFIFIRKKDITVINGLDKTNILPFFALGLIYLKSLQNQKILLSDDMTNKILEGCEFLKNNDSPVLIASIDSILSNFNLLISNTDISFKILDILTNHFINNSYLADKVLLLSTIFKLSCQDSVKKEIENLLEKYKIELFSNIVKNMDKIFEFKNLLNFRLNFECFDSKKIINLIELIIKKTKSNDLFVHSICFIERFSKNVPKVEIPKFNVINRVLNELIDQKKWDYVLIVGQFMKKYNYENGLKILESKPIPYKTKELLFDNFSISFEIIDELVDNALSCSDLTNIFKNFHSIFKELMKDKSIAINYLLVLFEKISSDEEIIPDSFLKLYLDEYTLYNDIFIDAIRFAYGYHSIKMKFIRKVKFDNNILYTSKFGQHLISRLFKNAKSDDKNYQVFLCLIDIASSFPFLFTKNPHEIFESVLPSLDYFILYFTCQNNEIDEEQTNNLKTALSAFIFLHSTLCSVQILDAFVPWIYQNIIKFSNSQILAFLYIISTLFKSNKVRDVMVALSMKYNFIITICNLLVKKVENNIVCYFKSTLYDILSNYYSILNGLTHNDKLIFIDEIQNVENPFLITFNSHITIFPIELKKAILPEPPSHICDFVNNINEVKPYWIFFDNSKKETKTIKKDLIDNFISHYLRLEQNIPDVSKIPRTPYIGINNAKIIRYLVHQPYWVYKYICSYSCFSFLPEHVEKLLNVIQEIKLIEKESKLNKDEEINLYCINLHVDYYFLSEFCQNDLYNILLNDILSHKKQTFKSICSFISNIMQHGVALLSILDLINRYICKTKSNSEPIKSIQKLVDILIFSCSNKNFLKNFIDICGNNLIKLILLPDYRCNSKLLSKVIDLLNLCGDLEITADLIHLIGFVFILDQTDMIPKALSLCQKFGENNLKDIKCIIENSFDLEFKKETPSYFLINCFLEKVPKSIQNKFASLPTILTDVVNDYQINGSKKENSANLICMIFSILAPNQYNNQIEILSDEIDFNSSLKFDSNELYNQDLIVKSVPKNIKQKNESFWNLYEKNRIVLNDILKNDIKKLEKLKFLINFPELLSFQTKYDYFRNKIKDLINNKSILSLYVDRSNTLVSSFNQLYNKNTQEWLKKINVKFNGEMGVDVGGLTKEWFTLIAQELFNTNNALFKSSENKSYQPNPSSYINSDHIQYFAFAGKFIARALIQGQCVNAHLMRSFYRQILQIKLKLKDLEDFDETLFRSLQMILNSDVEPLDLDFTIDVSEYGVNKTILLKENGDKINVTNENKIEYVSLYANYHLRKSIIKQITAFCDGFYSLIPHDIIRVFSPNELDLLICGIPEIDINDFKKNVVYRSPYHSNHKVIVLFFNVISKWDNEKLAKLLLFITGSSQVPIRGFKDFCDRGKPICISFGGNNNRLCVAHTCFNTLDLPQYNDEDEMNNKLLLSIQECEFGLA